MLRNRLIYLGFLLGMYIFFLEYDGWISCFLLVLTAALPLFSLLCSLPSLKGNRAELRFRPECARGERTELLVSVRHRSETRVPRCRLRVRLTDEMAGSRQLLRCDLRAQSRSRFTFCSENSGAFSLETVYGRQYDLLGLFSFPLRLPPKGEILVRPVPVCPEPKPDLSLLRARAWVPIPGGGFSEIHENREYRPGDPLRSIHWKLSAKTDGTVVREPQEPLRLAAVVSFDLFADREKTDSVLDRVRWVSEELLRLEVGHTLCCRDPETGALRYETVTTGEELLAALDRVLRTRVAKDAPSLSGHSFPQADWRCHVSPPEEAEKP